MMVRIEMPAVSGCQVADCAYNRESLCHARAVTIGDGTTPHCDTFFTNWNHASGRQIAGVGACKVDACRHNHDFECQAPNIEVGLRSGEAFCFTFERRE